MVSCVEAVCRGEAQRVLTALRGNRRYGDLNRAWRELEDGSPVRDLVEWRCGNDTVPKTPAAGSNVTTQLTGSAAAAAALSVANTLLQPLLQIVRSPRFGGPATCVSLEAVRAVLAAICKEYRCLATEDSELPGLLGLVVSAVCECAFEETNAQTDEAAATQMIAVLGFCCMTELPAASGHVATLFPAKVRMHAFMKILSLWGHYRSPTLRGCAQDTLHGMLDFALASAAVHDEFLRLFFDAISAEADAQLSLERAILLARCVSRLAFSPLASELPPKGPQPWLLQEALPSVVAALSDSFGTNVSVLSLLLPLVNRLCSLCADRWSDTEQGSTTFGLGALQVEALISRTYIRILGRAVAPLRPRGPTAVVSSEATGLSGVADPNAVTVALTAEEGVDLLVVIFECLCDLMHPGFVWTLWYTFDADWRRPQLTEEVLQAVVVLFEDGPSTERERPLPTYVEHLSSAVLTRMLSAFSSVHLMSARRMVLDAAGDQKAYERLREQMERREVARNLMAAMEEKPKKTRAAIEKSKLLEHVELPPSVEVQPGEEWAVKFAWVLRNCNFMVPYAAVGEFLGQLADDSEKALQAFVESFDFGQADIDAALRCFVQAFRLPKEAQQIDRILDMFSKIYYRKHVASLTDHEKSNVYLKHVDAAHTLAFAVILLNSDQHNPKLKKRMQLKDFKSNNRGINAGEDIPDEVQTRIFNSIHQTEIKTPASGSFVDGISRSRLADLVQLCERKYRDNSIVQHFPHLLGNSKGFLERTGARLRTTFEALLASDSNGHGDSALGLEALLRLSLLHQSPEADSVAECLFFFGVEVFHEHQHRPGSALGRAFICIRALFQSSLENLGHLSAKQMHILVYLAIQFIIYGFGERAVALPEDPVTARLLRIPSLAVDPPTGVVYNFLRKISTVPFKMLSFTEEFDPSISLPPKDGGMSPAVGSGSGVGASVPLPPPPPADSTTTVSTDAPSEDATVSTGSPVAASADALPVGDVVATTEEDEKPPLQQQHEQQELGDQSLPPMDGSSSPTASSGPPMVSAASGGGTVTRARTAILNFAEIAAAEGASPSDEVPVLPGVQNAAATVAAGVAAGAAAAAVAEGPPPGDEAPPFYGDPLRPQVEQALEVSGLDVFLKTLAEPWRNPPSSEAKFIVADGLETCRSDGSAGLTGGHVAPPEALLGFLSALLLALRTPQTNNKVGKDQDMPWWPEDETRPEMGPPQALQVPKRALALNVLDGYGTLRLVLRMSMGTIWYAELRRRQDIVEDVDTASKPLWDPSAIQEFCVCAHVGLFHTLRRPDLMERALRIGIVCVFQLGAALLSLRNPLGLPLVSIGWPARLLEVLVRRSESEPQLLVPVAKLCLESVRWFVMEVCKHRQLDQVLLWQRLLQLLLKATPTASRALWPGAKDTAVGALQGQLWRRGIVWLLGHPCLLECVGSEDVPPGGRPTDVASPANGGVATSPGAGISANGGGGTPTATVPEKSTNAGAAPEKVAPAGGAFWAWALGELTALAEEMSSGNRREAAKLLLGIYRALLGAIIQGRSSAEYGQDEFGDQAGTPKDAHALAAASRAAAAASPSRANSPRFAASSASAAAAATAAAQEAAAVAGNADRLLAGQATAWSKVAIGLLGHVMPMLGRKAALAPTAEDGGEQPIISLLRHTMLDIRVPPILGNAPQGPHLARLTLEKLASVLTGAASSGTPTPVLREAVPLVAKFFLQNLHSLQGQDHFSQLWLMVLRLMCSFIKRGTDDRDAELEEIATETLKNLLCVLLSTKVLGFLPAKGTSGAAAPNQYEDPPVWWQMTWNCIEIFLPGFGEEFARSMLPRDHVAEVPRAAATPVVAAVAAAAEPSALAASPEAQVAPCATDETAVAADSVKDVVGDDAAPEAVNTSAA
eukprot:TRINITY_DN32726_c0_g1_i1.p1 TRINITY_DN32726_c0_g1~~TRINITY_DN32726_c0_g1_i1.p1  ORF type:complete len:1891 (-),score=425.18 TRINITY_DN32726_c0_g1_i1:280-5952(-)